MSQDKKSKSGDLIKSPLAEDEQLEMKEFADTVKRHATKLKTEMLQNLRQIPIYDQFLQHVFGCGPVVAAYLVTKINIRDGENRALKPSGLIRFCGNGVDHNTGKRDQATRGQKNVFSKEMRCRLYQMFGAMAQNISKRKGETNKYVDVWQNYIHRMKNSARYDAATNTLLTPEGDRIMKYASNGPNISARKWIRETGRRKATDVFLTDLYLVWRSLEGLPVWPGYHAAKLGYFHGGKVCQGEPRLVEVAEALEIAGPLGTYPTARVVSTKVSESDPDEVVEGEELELDDVSELNTKGADCTITCD